ncbi:hypothetical protein NECAME_04816 [Necator americanus]|uniref:Uncharacterized protein n=1 Tax=Necator americanus TaxID=51031 RepID=W2SMS6_NECAM|nr:hypothetical protein NECAME_04816 [Necator americanus]ETN70803.1 hypothetical protein NECAME_04816 [Necator americanus]
MLHSVEQTSEGEMSVSNRQIVAVVGDADMSLTDHLVKAVGNGSTSTVIHLDTKYYQTSVGVRQFRTGHDFLKFYKQGPDVTVGAIILKLNTKHELEIMEEVLKKTNCDSHVLVADHSSMDNLNFAQSWAHNFRFELVILDPDLSQIEEANSLSEQCGIMRLVEVLENVSWELKKDNFKKVTGKEGLDRLLAIIEGLSESSDDSDLEPDDEDKEAIWQAFSSCGLPPCSSEATASSSISKQSECEASVTITIENKKKGSSNKFHRKDPEGDVNLYKALRDTREANMKQTDSAKRADNAVAYLSKFLNMKDLKLDEDEEAKRQKKTD